MVDGAHRERLARPERAITLATPYRLFAKTAAAA